MNVLNIKNKTILSLVQDLYDLLSSGAEEGIAQYRDDEGYSLELETSLVIRCASDSLSVYKIRAHVPVWAGARSGKWKIGISFPLESEKVFTTQSVKGYASVIIIEFSEYFPHTNIVPQVVYAFSVDSLVDGCRVDNGPLVPITEEAVKEITANFLPFFQRFARKDTSHS